MHGIELNDGLLIAEIFQACNEKRIFENVTFGGAWGHFHHPNPHFLLQTK